jgi:hypothetical protein
VFICTHHQRHQSKIFTLSGWCLEVFWLTKHKIIVLHEQQMEAEIFRFLEVNYGVDWVIVFLWLAGPPLRRTKLIIRSCCYWVIPLETNQCHRRSSFNSLYIFGHSYFQWSITVFTQSHHLTQSWATSVQHILSLYFCKLIKLCFCVCLSFTKWPCSLISWHCICIAYFTLWRLHLCVWHIVTFCI